jgi:FXSXX-COOH protein
VSESEPDVPIELVDLSETDIDELRAMSDPVFVRALRRVIHASTDFGVVVVAGFDPPRSIDS